MPQRSDTWPWQQALCSEHGPPSAPRRLILLVLATFMDPDGSNARPSQATLAKCALISRRSVVTHLEAAKREGWLATYPAGRNGQGWRLSGYEATVPDAVYATLKTSKAGARRSPRREGKGGELAAPRPPEGGATDDTKVVQMAHEGGAPGAHDLSNPDTYPKTSCAASPSPAAADSAARELEAEPEQMTDEALR